MLSCTYVRVAMQVENGCFRQEPVWLESQAESVSCLEDEEADRPVSGYQPISGGKEGSRLLKKHIREYCYTMMQMLDAEGLCFSLDCERFSRKLDLSGQGFHAGSIRR